MRKFISIASVALVLCGCGSSDTTTDTTTSTPPSSAAAATSETNTPEPAEQPVAKEDVPTIFGVDAELQQELRSVLAEFIKQHQIPGDADENLTKAFDSAMQTIRRPAEEFGMEPDSNGNLEWPKEFAEKRQSLRADFDSKMLFDKYEINLPDWAEPLLNDYKADSISPKRKELLFRLASGNVLRQLT